MERTPNVGPDSTRVWIAGCAPKVGSDGGDRKNIQTVY